MAELQNNQTGGPKSGNPPGGQQPNGGGASAAAEAARAAIDNAARSTETVIDKAAAAGQETTRATGEILRRNVETAQEAIHSGIEGALRSFQDLSQTMTHRLGLTGAEDGEWAERSAENLKAVSQAATRVAKGAQDASREWLKLAQQGFKTNLEALSQLATCRTVQDVVSIQSNLARRNMQQAIESGQLIAETSRRAMDEANRAMQAQAGGAPPRA